MTKSKLKDYKLQELLKEISRRTSFNGEVQSKIEVGVGILQLKFNLEEDFDWKGDPDKKLNNDE